MKDLKRNIYSQNGETSLPRDVTDSLYPPNSADGFSTTTDPLPNRNAPLSPVIRTRMISYSIYADVNSQILAAKNDRRNYLTIQNQSSVSVFVGFGTTPSLNGDASLELPTNTGIAFDGRIVPNNDVYVIAPSNAQVTIIEGTQL